MNEIIIESRRKKIETIKSLFPDSYIIDVTSKSEYPWIKFSPFYPHKDIPIPFSDNLFSKSVEGIWQGLKVFENNDIDISKFEIENMRNIKRTIRKYGKIKGHRKGIYSLEIIDYFQSKKKIYLPTYKWILENKLKVEIEELRKIVKLKPLVLLDYEISEDVFSSKPISHAYLIKLFLENNYPE
ncbi:hypothetical protein OIU80_06470 [Flavobacterium sp. LS1R47]|uniref:Uncharacterized protein n=1 Tax=Flavobacterium frigoritolerans TaxID=2987686 RepID=A0A9X2ZIA0_9FLAO|nr:hypothetical protein [Flavobacterium frigoritolerans]MCV9931921.1 hypothetical protein [Flavobacterium frigoritolerans]